MITTTWLRLGVLVFCDAGSFFGHLLSSGREYPLEELIQDYDRLGVQWGIAGSLRSLFHDTMAGVEESAAAARKYPSRIVPMAYVNSTACLPSPKELLGKIRDRFGIRIIGLSSFPFYYAVNWSSPLTRTIGAAAEELGMALHACIVKESQLTELVSSWGSLKTPVIVRWMIGGRYEHQAAVMAASSEAKNFYFDGSNCTGFRDLNRLASSVTQSRVLVALNSPVTMPQTIRAHFDECSLDVGFRPAISSTNLEQLLAKIGVQTPLESSLVQGEEFSSAWKDLVRRSKVDIHWHPDHWNFEEEDIDQVQIWKDFGYEKVILNSAEALTYDLVKGNDVTERWFDVDPRVHGLVVVNPFQPEKTREEIRKRLRNPRFVGLKTIQDPFEIGLDAPEYRFILDACEEHSMPILCHLGGVRRAAELYPKVKFVAAHGNWKRAGHLGDLSNIYFDFATSHALADEHDLPRFITHIPDRVMFGSDSRLMHPSWNLSKLLTLKADSNLLNKVLRENAYRVFPRLLG